MIQRITTFWRIFSSKKIYKHDNEKTVETDTEMFFEYCLNSSLIDGCQCFV